MQLCVNPSKLSGEVEIPSSKSQTMRAIVFGLLGRGKSIIHQPLLSSDVQHMINACLLLGAKVSHYDQIIEVTGVDGKIKPSFNVIDAGNSGIILRFIGAIAGLDSSYTVITGDESIRNQRPVSPLLKGLNQLGGFAISSRGNHFAPIIIRGPIYPGKAVIDGKDSQPVSGLLIASAFLGGETELVVKNPGEKPWISMTLDWFDRLGIKYENHNFEKYKIVGNTSYNGFEYRVCGDFSSAIFMVAAALISDSEITLSNLNISDVQGDKKILTLLKEMGAAIEIDETTHSISVKKGGDLQGRAIDVNDFIDALPILAVIGCFATGKTVLYNGEIARSKETDRIKAITTELLKMGALIQETDDGLIVERSCLKGCQSLYSHCDHRIAMSLTIAALGAEGESAIEGIEWVKKTYVNFENHLRNLHADVLIKI